MSDFQEKFQDKKQMDYAIQCIATRGYHCEIWFDGANVCFRFGDITISNGWYQTVKATPCTFLSFPTIYINMPKFKLSK